MLLVRARVIIRGQSYDFYDSSRTLFLDLKLYLSYYDKYNFKSRNMINTILNREIRYGFNFCFYFYYLFSFFFLVVVVL